MESFEQGLLEELAKITTITDQVGDKIFNGTVPVTDDDGDDIELPYMSFMVLPPDEMIWTTGPIYSEKRPVRFQFFGVDDSLIRNMMEAAERHFFNEQFIFDVGGQVIDAFRTSDDLFEDSEIEDGRTVYQGALEILFWIQRDRDNLRK